MAESTLPPLPLGRNHSILCNNRPKTVISFKILQIVHFKRKQNIQEAIKQYVCSFSVLLIIHLVLQTAWPLKSQNSIQLFHSSWQNVVSILS